MSDRFLDLQVPAPGAPDAEVALFMERCTAPAPAAALPGGGSPLPGALLAAADPGSGEECAVKGGAAAVGAAGGGERGGEGCWSGTGEKAAEASAAPWVAGKPLGSTAAPPPVVACSYRPSVDAMGLPSDVARRSSSGTGRHRPSIHEPLSAQVGFAAPPPPAAPLTSAAGLLAAASVPAAVAARRDSCTRASPCIYPFQPQTEAAALADQDNADADDGAESEQMRGGGNGKSSTVAGSAAEGERRCRRLSCSSNCSSDEFAIRYASGSEVQESGGGDDAASYQLGASDGEEEEMESASTLLDEDDEDEDDYRGLSYEAAVLGQQQQQQQQQRVQGAASCGDAGDESGGRLIRGAVAHGGCGGSGGSVGAGSGGGSSGAAAGSRTPSSLLTAHIQQARAAEEQAAAFLRVAGLRVHGGLRVEKLLERG